MENQKITWLPYTNKNISIYYDQRVAISQERETPICWKCSKVEDVSERGIIRLTWAQDLWNEHADYIETEIDEMGSSHVVGIWCDYFNGGVTPTDSKEDPTPTVHCVITYSGKQDAKLKVGGTGKNFTVKFYDAEENEVEFQTGSWYVTINGLDASDRVTVMEATAPNQVKITPNDDDSLIGEVLKVGYMSDSIISSEIEINLVGL